MFGKIHEQLNVLFVTVKWGFSIHIGNQMEQLFFLILYFLQLSTCKVFLMKRLCRRFCTNKLVVVLFLHFLLSFPTSIAEPKMTQRMPTIMERFSWVCAARSTERITITMNTASTPRTASIFKRFLLVE
uniref:Uncharacterized protein n=1 Tax=Arundo donax TaxID=35708 RepID=A0A0A9CM48_ARUDO